MSCRRRPSQMAWSCGTFLVPAVLLMCYVAIVGSGSFLPNAPAQIVETPARGGSRRFTELDEKGPETQAAPPVTPPAYITAEAATTTTLPAAPPSEPIATLTTTSGAPPTVATTTPGPSPTTVGQVTSSATTPTATTATPPNVTEGQIPATTGPPRPSAPTNSPTPPTQKQIAVFSPPVSLELDEPYLARDSNSDPNSVDIVLAVPLPSGTMRQIDLRSLFVNKRIPSSYFRRNGKTASPGGRNTNEFIPPFSVTIDRLPGVAEVFTEADLQALLGPDSDAWLAGRKAAPKVVQRSGIQVYTGHPMDPSPTEVLPRNIPEGYLYSTAAQEYFYQTLRQRQFMSATSYGELTQEMLSQTAAATKGIARLASSTKGSMQRWDQALFYADTLDRYPIYNYTLKGRKRRVVPPMVPLPFYDLFDLTSIMPSLDRRIFPSVTTQIGASPSLATSVTASQLTDPTTSTPTLDDNRLTLAAPIDFPYRRNVQTNSVEQTVLVDTLYFTLRSEEGGVDNGMLTLKGKVLIILSPLAVENSPNLQFNVTVPATDSDSVLWSDLQAKQGLKPTKPLSDNVAGGSLLSGRAKKIRTRLNSGITATSTQSAIFRLSRPYRSSTPFVPVPVNSPSDKAILPSLFALSTPLCRALTFSFQTDPLQAAARAVLGFTVPKTLAAITLEASRRRKSRSSSGFEDERDEPLEGDYDDPPPPERSTVVIPSYNILNVVPSRISAKNRAALNPRYLGNASGYDPYTQFATPLPQVARRVLLYLVASDLVVESIPAPLSASLRVRVSIPTSNEETTSITPAVSAITLFDSTTPSAAPWRLKIVHNGTQVLRSSILGKTSTSFSTVANLLQGRAGERVQFGRVCPVTTLVAEVFGTVDEGSEGSGIPLPENTNIDILRATAISNRERDMPRAPALSRTLQFLDLSPFVKRGFLQNPKKYTPENRVPSPADFIRGLITIMTSRQKTFTSDLVPRRSTTVVTLQGNPAPMAVTQTVIQTSKDTSTTIAIASRRRRPLISFNESVSTASAGGVRVTTFADKDFFSPLMEHRFAISLSVTGRALPDFVTIKSPTTALGKRQLHCQVLPPGTPLHLFGDASSRQVNPVVVGNTLSELAVSAEQASLAEVVDPAEVDGTDAFAKRYVRGSLFIQSFCPSATAPNMLDGTFAGLKNATSPVPTSAYIPPPLVKRPMSTIPRRFTVVIMQPPTFGTLSLSATTKGSRYRRKAATKKAAPSYTSASPVVNISDIPDAAPLSLSFTVPGEIAAAYSASSAALPPFIVKRLAEFVTGVPVPEGDSPQDGHVVVSDVRGEGPIAELRYTLAQGYRDLLTREKEANSLDPNLQSRLMNALLVAAESNLRATLGDSDAAGKAALDMWRTNKDLLLKGDYFSVKVYETAEIPNIVPSAAATVIVSESSEYYASIPFKFYTTATRAQCGTSEYGPLFLPPVTSGSVGLSQSIVTTSLNPSSVPVAGGIKNKGMKFNILADRVVLNYTFPDGVERKSNLRYLGSYSQIKVYEGGSQGDEEDLSKIVVSSSSRDSVGATRYSLLEGAIGSLLQINRQLKASPSTAAATRAKPRVLSEITPGRAILDDSYLDGGAGVGASLKYGLPTKATGTHLAQLLLSGTRALTFQRTDSAFTLYPTPSKALNPQAERALGTDLLQFLQAMAGEGRPNSTTLMSPAGKYYNLVLEDVFEYQVLSSSGGSPCTGTVKFTVRARNGGAVWSKPDGGGANVTRHREWIRYEQCRVDGWAMLPFVDGEVENTNDPWRAPPVEKAPSKTPKRTVVSSNTATTRYAVVMKVPLLGRVYGVSRRTPYDPTVPLTYTTSTGTLSEGTPLVAPTPTSTEAPRKTMASIFSPVRPKSEGKAGTMDYEYAASYCEVYACHLYTSPLQGIANGGAQNVEQQQQQGEKRSRPVAPLNSISSNPPLQAGDVVDEIELVSQQPPSTENTDDAKKPLTSGMRLLYFYEAPRRAEFIQKQDTFAYKVITETTTIQEDGSRVVSRSVSYTTIHMALRRPKLREYRVTYREQDLLMYNRANSAWHPVREKGEGSTTTGSTIVGIPITLGNPEKELLQVVTTKVTSASKDANVAKKTAANIADIQWKKMVLQFRRQELADAVAFSAWRHGAGPKFTLFDYKRTRPQNVANALGMTKNQTKQVEKNPDDYFGKWDSGVYDPKTGREIISGEPTDAAALLLPRSSLIVPTAPISISAIDGIAGAWVLDNQNKVILVPREPQALSAVDGSALGGTVLNRQRYTFVVRIFTRSPSFELNAVSQSKVNGPVKIPSGSTSVLMTKVEELALSNTDTANGTALSANLVATAASGNPMDNYFYYDARIVVERAVNTLPSFDEGIKSSYSTTVGTPIDLEPIKAFDLERDVLTYIITQYPIYGDIFVNYYDATLRLAVRRKVEAGMRIAGYVRNVNGAGDTSKSSAVEDSASGGSPQVHLTYVPYSPSYFALLQSTTSAATARQLPAGSSKFKSEANKLAANAQKEFFPRVDGFVIVADDGSGDLSPELKIDITITGDPSLIGTVTRLLRNTATLAYSSSVFYLFLRAVAIFITIGVVGGAVYFVYVKVYKPWRRAQRGPPTTSSPSVNSHQLPHRRDARGQWQKMATKNTNSTTAVTIPENEGDEEMGEV